MYRLLVVCSLALACGAQRYAGDPAAAAILAETRQLRADGSSDVAYAQEDGVLFKEATSMDGERRGSYEYIGDDGKRYQVEYTAGVGGFQIVSSTHVDATPEQPRGEARPAAPAPLAAPRPAVRQPTRANTNSFSINYDLNRLPESPTTSTPFTTTTTTQRTVRKNFHTGQVSLERSDKGYVYSYTHNG